MNKDVKHIKAKDKTTDYPKLVKYKLGWTFTEDEERAMERACKSAAKYMETFGQAPRQPMIDLRHYENNNKPQKLYYG